MACLCGCAEEVRLRLQYKLLRGFRRGVVHGAAGGRTLARRCHRCVPVLCRQEGRSGCLQAGRKNGGWAALARWPLPANRCPEKRCTVSPRPAEFQLLSAGPALFGIFTCCSFCTAPSSPMPPCKYPPSIRCCLHARLKEGDAACRGVQTVRHASGKPPHRNPAGPNGRGPGGRRVEINAILKTVQR